MIKALLSFGLGVYVGVYVAQNYEIQKVDEPQKILEKLKKYLDDNVGEKKK